MLPLRRRTKLPVPKATATTDDEVLIAEVLREQGEVERHCKRRDELLRQLRERRDRRGARSHGER